MIDKEKTEKVITSPDQEEIIYYHHNYVSDNGGDGSSDACYSNNEYSNFSDPS